MFVKLKNFKNKDGSFRQYVQIVESQRINGSPRHVVKMSLGRVDTDEGRKKVDDILSCLESFSNKVTFLDLTKDLVADWSKPYGATLIFRRLWDEMKFSDVFCDELKDVEAEFDVREAIFNMVLNRLSDPCSKRALNLWQEDHYGISTFDLHQYYRALDYLISHKDSIEQRIFHRMRDLFSPTIDVVLFDTTSIVYYGDATKNEELLDYGFSKARRGDLKQVVVGVLMSKEGIPIGHETYSGNTNDVTCFRQMIDQVSSRFKIGKVILVGDRGMISKDNISYLEKKGYFYILGYRMRTISKEYRKSIFSKINLKRMRKANVQYKEVTYDGKRLLVCYNSDRAKLDAAKRKEILERLQKKITDKSTILSIVENQNYKRFLKIVGQNPKIDYEKVKKDALYDGVYVLTSNTNLPPAQIIGSYKGLWQVEAAFRQLKSELEMGPLYHWKDRRIKAHIMICFLALILRITFYKKLKSIDKNASYTKVDQDLKALHAIGLKIKHQSVVMRTELKEGAALSFRALNMRPPNRILSSSNN